jgi:LPXTG-motif cell wall-anchored protein
MLRRALVSFIALSAALLITTGTSHAQSDGYQGACAIAVSPTNPHAGDTVTVTGTNFPTSPSNVAIKIGNQNIGTANIDSNGEFSQAVTIPSGLSGTQTISVACGTTGVDATTNLNVLATQQSTSSSTGGGGAPLARTGTNSTQPLVLAGLGALAVGTALVLTARRRRAGRIAA